MELNNSPAFFTIIFCGLLNGIGFAACIAGVVYILYGLILATRLELVALVVLFTGGLCLYLAHKLKLYRQQEMRQFL